jgi:uncharacterized membrane protein
MILTNHLWSIRLFLYVPVILVWHHCSFIQSFVVAPPIIKSNTIKQHSSFAVIMTVTTTTNNNTNDIMIEAAPMYITIGPQCWGKTSFLKQQQGISR